MLNANSVNISVEKWKNLQTLLEYVPPIYHSFYKELKQGGKKPNSKAKKKGSQASKTTPSTSKNRTDDFTDTDSEFDNGVVDILNSDSDSNE